MTTTRLTRHYSLLTADERFSLVMAASVRGDEMEVNRLAAAAPHAKASFSHLFGRSLAFLVVSCLHHMEQLNLTALFFKSSALADTTSGKLAARCRDASRLYGYLVTIHAEAWLEFCRRENITPKAGTAD